MTSSRGRCSNSSPEPPASRLRGVWETKRLGNRARLIRSYGHEQPTTGLVPRPVVTTRAYSQTLIGGKARAERFAISDRLILSGSNPCGDLIVVKSSGSAASGSDARSDDADPFIFTNFLLRFRPIGVNSSWVYYRLTRRRQSVDFPLWLKPRHIPTFGLVITLISNRPPPAPRTTRNRSRPQRHGRRDRRS